MYLPIVSVCACTSVPAGMGLPFGIEGELNRDGLIWEEGLGQLGSALLCLWLCGRVLCLATDRLQSPGSHQETPRASQGVSLGTGQEGVAGTGTNWGGYLKTLEPKSFKKQETQTVIFLTHT